MYPYNKCHFPKQKGRLTDSPLYYLFIPFQEPLKKRTCFCERTVIFITVTGFLRIVQCRIFDRMLFGNRCITRVLIRTFTIVVFFTRREAQQRHRRNSQNHSLHNPSVFDRYRTSKLDRIKGEKVQLLLKLLINC